METLEEAFIKDNVKRGRCSIFLGMPETGKTFLALKWLVYSLQHNIYNEYHLVLPMFEHEENKSYDFLLPHKDKVFIYKKYSEIVALKVDKLREKKKIMFMIDDATHGLMNKIDSTLVGLCTTSRHSRNGGLTVFLVVHCAKKVIPPTIRQNLKYLFIYRIDSAELLQKTVYDDFVSLQYKKNEKDFIDFLKDYSAVVDKNRYGVMLIARNVDVDLAEQSGSCYLDFNVNKWELFNLKPVVKRTEKKPTIIKKPSHPLMSLFSRK